MNRIVKSSAIAGAALLLVGGLAELRINTTKSIPVGLYRMTSDPIKKGSYVIFCPPQTELFDTAKERGYIGAGFCPGGYGYMMKRVVAVGGDHVIVAGDGVRVNGNLLPLSTPLPTDSAGRALPHLPGSEFTLTASELFLMSDVSGTSFDARYFGPVDRAQIKGVIRPLFTW